MDSFFQYAESVTGKKFVGRKHDVTLLGNLLSQGEHVCLYEPPKTGKSSLVQQTLFSMRMTGKAFTVGQMSLLNVRTAEDFVLKLGSTLLKMVASTPSEMESYVHKYLAGTHFVFDQQEYSQSGKAVSLAWDMDKEDIKAMCSLPFHLAGVSFSPLILIVDEFHCLLNLEDPDSILRPLSAAMKELSSHKFSFVLMGSSVNAMSSIFDRSILFSRTVVRVRLSDVMEEEVVEHVLRGFTTSGKVIDRTLLQGACRLFRGNMFYINHMMAICDSLARGYIMEPALVESLQMLVAIYEPGFRSTVNSLTTHQINLLKAILDGVTRFSALDVIRKYSLNSSANVKRLKEALLHKEVIMFDAKENPVLEDPLFEYWVRKYYFEMKD